MLRGDFVKSELSGEKEVASLESGKVKFYEIGVQVARFEDADAVSIQMADPADLIGIRGAYHQFLNRETGISFMWNNPAVPLGPSRVRQCFHPLFQRR